MSISTVIFDYGCVLSLAPGPEDFEPLRLAVGAEAAAFPEMYWRSREAYDLDTLDVAGYFQEMAQAVGLEFSAEQIEHFARLDAELWGKPNHVMVEWVRVLREQGLATAVLSNMSRTISAHLRRSEKWLELFNQLCFSGELRASKPQPEIYRACLKSLGVSPAQSLFIDDREMNIYAAQALGIHGIVFHSVAQLQADLEPYGLAESLREAQARV